MTHPTPENWPAGKSEEVLAYCTKATAGPWTSEDSETEGNYHWWHVSAGAKEITEGSSWTRKSDMIFCARARTDLPAAVREILQLRVEVEELRKESSQPCDCCKDRTNLMDPQDYCADGCRCKSLILDAAKEPAK